MKKRGQMEISFGVIFSIIMIIAILATSFYVIKYFTSLSRCSSTGLFYDSLRDEVDTMWKASGGRQLFSYIAPGSVDYACFGNMTTQAKTTDRERFDEIYRTNRLSDYNLFFYPLTKGCKALNSQHVEHVNIPEFFCVKPVEGEISVILEKDTFDSSVTISQR